MITTDQATRIFATIFFISALWAPSTAAAQQPAPARDTSDATPKPSGDKPAPDTRPAPGTRPAPDARPAADRPAPDARPARPPDARPTPAGDKARPGPGEDRPRPGTADTKARPGTQAPPRPAIPAKPVKCEVKVKKVEKPKPKPKLGWFPKLSAGLTLSMVHNHNVPGIDDGLNLSIGVVVTGELAYLYHGHEWNTKLKFLHTQSKTPSVDPFLKTADELDLKTIYQYRFKRFHRLATFGGLHMTAAVFPGHLVSSADTALTKLNVDGTTTADFTEANNRYNLTPAFSPAMFKQFAGVGIRPSADPMATLDIELSFAAQEVWARGYTVKDDAATPEMELLELRNFQQLGPQLVVALEGQLKKRLTYAFRAEFMLPTYISVESPLRGFDLLSADVSFKVGVKVANWASLDYVFSAKRFPLIIDQWQVLNNLVLSITAHVL